MKQILSWCKPQKKFEFKIHQPDFIFDHNILLWSFSCCGERWFEFHWKSMEAACWSIHSYECEWSVSYRMFIRMLTQFRLVVVCMNIKDKNGNTVTGSRAFNETNSFTVQTQNKHEWNKFFHGANTKEIPARLSSDDDEYLADVLPSMGTNTKNHEWINIFHGANTKEI